MSSEYEIVRIDKSSISNFQKLYKSVYGFIPPSKEVENTFDTTVFGQFTIGFFAMEKSSGQIAAYYGVFPVEAQIEGQTVLCAQSGATMTHPQHQKKGLFTTLALTTFETAKAEGVRFIFGFPNENSLPGFQKKLNWTFYGNMQMLKLKGSSFPLCEAASRNGILSTIYHKWVRNRLRPFALSASHWQHVPQFNHHRVLRSNHYLDFKLKNRGVHCLHYEGFDLLISVSIHLYIGEVGFFKASELDSFMKSIQRLAKKVLAGKIVFVLSPNHWLYQLMKTSYRFEDSLPIGMLLLDPQLASSEMMSFTVLDYDTFK